MVKFLAFLVCLLFTVTSINAQCTNPPNGVDCTCNTAQLLCTPDLLDGFTFSMAETPNLGGYNNSSSDLCPGIGDQDGVPNNVNWFSFLAWCTDLEMDILISNCSEGSNFNTYGVQIALFTSCPSNDPLFCITEGNQVCGGFNNYPTTQTLSVSGLTVGAPYYFMLDGCAGSACDITIDVIGTCGTGTIDPWTTGLEGPLTTCVGNTETYIAEDVDGAVEFYYTLDGVPLIDGTDLTSINTTWSTAGTFELCVDVGNDPCIPVTDSPDPFCITVMVCEEADAGTIIVDSPLCPGEISTISVSGETQGPDHDQYIIITSPSGIILDVVNGNTSTWTSDICETFLVYSYNVKVGAAVPMVGMTFPADFPCGDNCCDFTSIPLIFEDITPPVFTDAPASSSLDCFDELPPLEDLLWSDDCTGTGMVAGTESGSANACDGGTITRTWTIADNCGNEATHTQVINIDGTPASQLVDPPADETISCDLIPTSIPDIDFVNTGLGLCALSGTISGVSSGSADLCGGTITNTWDDTDDCGNPLTYVQTITVDPVPEAIFASTPPPSLTVTCEAAPTVFPDLDYDNGEIGACTIMGIASPAVSSNYDICGGTIEVEWTFTDLCNRATSFSQSINVEPTPEAIFTSPLPADVTVDCDAIPISAGPLNYSNSSMSTCLIEGSIGPSIIDNSGPCGGFLDYRWEFVDDCGRTLLHTQRITINPAPAGVFLSTPTDITLACAQLPLSPTDLDYSNGLTGICELSGTITSTLTSFDPCNPVVEEAWNGTDNCGNPLNLVRSITIAPIEDIVFETPPSDITLSCDAVPTSFPDLNYTNGSAGDCLNSGAAVAVVQGTYDACGGELIISWEAQDGCSSSINAEQVITITPPPAPTYNTPPADVTVSCENVPSPSFLSYSNGASGACEISGSNLPSQVGSYNRCGGSISYEWSFTDPCGIEITATRNITVTETPVASFTTLPPNITVNCEDVEGISNILTYSNNLGGICGINGGAVATVSGSYDVCGGLLTQSWSYTDECDRSISHDRTITVNPAQDPQFLNLPTDITLACGEDFFPPGSLEYSNGLSNPCEISGFASVETEQNGTLYTNTWEFINPCTNQLVAHVQNVTLSPDPDISIDPAVVSICEGETFDLASINVIDQNNTNIIVNYYVGSPSSPGNQLSEVVVSPQVTTIYTVEITNEFDCSDEALFTLIVDEAPFAGEDGAIDICENITVDLFSLIGSNYDLGGSWFDLDDAGVNLDNPFSVLFTGQIAGFYTFAYEVQSGNTCSNDTAFVEVNFGQLPTIQVDSVYCENGNTTYVIEFQSNGFEILVIPDVGIVQDQGNGNLTISDIPIDQQVFINFVDGETLCSDFVVITPPDCDCPLVPPATTTNLTICQGDLPATLSAIAAEGTTLNWYETVDASTALVLGSENYTSPESTAGVYVYYVEAESIEFPGCVSSQRVPVQLTIVASPVVTDSEVAFCIVEGTSQVLNLQDYNSTINGNSNNSFNYYGSQEDAENQENELFEEELLSSSTFWVLVSNINGCSSLATLEFTISNNPTVVATATDEACVSSANGVIDLLISPAGDYQITINNIAYNTNTITDLDPGIYYVSIVDELTGCFALDTAVIEVGQVILEDILVSTCQNNGTDTDASDDFYELNFQFSESTGNSGTYELFVGGNSQGIFNYGSNETIDIPADGSVLTVEAIDVSTLCSLSSSIGPLNPCSTNCLLNVIQFVQVCDDNGTSSDPSDDFISFTLEISAINGSPENTFDVLINGNIEYTFMYNEAVSFDLPADGTTPNIIIIDSDDNQCLLALDVLSLVSCSNSCDLSILNVEEICSDGGTEDDPADDIITITIEVDVINEGSDQVIVQIDDQPGVQQSINAIEITQPADGLTHWLFVNVLDSLACIDSLQIGPFTPCSSDCDLKLEHWVVECQDNGTAFDPTDDFYNIEWMIQAVEGSPDSMYQVDLDGGVFGSYLYSDTVFTMLPADDMDHTFTMVDAISSFCQEIVNTGVLTPCSDSCLIQVSQPVVICENNGTNDTSLDDIYFAEIIVEGTNTGDCWTIEGEVMTYPYDQVITLGPFVIIDGSVTISINDCENELCPIEVVLEAPSSCSECLQAIDAGLDLTIDCDNPVAELIGVSSEVGSYTWKGPNGLIDTDSVASANMEGWFYFSASYSDGCSLIDSVFVTANGVVPVANGGEDGLLTCEVEEIQLIGMNMSSATNVSYFWLNAAGDTVSTNINTVVDESGLYYFFVYDIDTGCLSAGDEVFVGLDIESPNAMILADPGTILNCVVESVSLSYEAEDDVIYQWTTDQTSEPSDAVIYQIDTSGFVFLTAIDTITGCIEMDTIFIEAMEEFPIISLVELDSLTCDQTSIILDATNTIPLETSLFTWKNELGEEVGNLAIFETSESGVFTLEVLDTVSGCLNIDTVELVTIQNFPFVSVDNTISLFCEQTDTVLTAIVNSSEVSVNWTSNTGSITSSSNQAIVNVAGGGTYIVEVTDELTGCVTLDTVLILELDSSLSIDNLDILDETCFQEGDGQIEWTSISGGTGPYSILVDNQSVEEQFLESLEPGFYNFVITDIYGCELDTLIEVTAAESININDVPTLVIEEGLSDSLYLVTNIPENEIASIIWEPDTYLSCSTCLATEVTPLDDIIYTVTIIDINGCITTTTVELVVRQSVDIYVPNIFSPDNDGVNDGFTLFSPDIQLIQKLDVYNRWGELMYRNENFEANNPNIGWNGEFKGRSVNPGVYVFYAVVELRDGSLQEITGDVTVLR